jgi:predicted ATPase
MSSLVEEVYRDYVGSGGIESAITEDPNLLDDDPAIRDAFYKFVELKERAVASSLDEFFSTHVSPLSGELLEQLTSPTIELVGEASAEPLVRISLSGGHFVASIQIEDIAFSARHLPKTLRDVFSVRELGRVISERVWSQKMEEYGLFEAGHYYLPSSRSGFLTAWPLISSVLVDIVRGRLGHEPIEFAGLQGVAGDFLQSLAGARPSSLRRRRGPRSRPVLSMQALEETILGGRVVMQNARNELMYDTGGIRIPVEKASSMVGELAPLDVFMRDLLQAGDLLVIDEPEAHLHPQNQRNMAKVIVRLVNEGIRVICPTHSSLILHQISNHIVANQSNSTDIENMGFLPVDMLDHTKVAVYSFKQGEYGTNITAITVEEDYGIPEDDFVEVAEQIGLETLRIEMSAASEDPLEVES